MSITINKNLLKSLLAGSVFLLALFFFTKPAEAANFNVSPSSGTYTVGSTFDVSVLLDTKGQSINAVDMQLSFPPDKLQLISPSAGTSIIGVYTTPPRFDNAKGEVQIVGGIPNGINVSSGLVTKLTFRVKGIGNASLRFTGNSQALLNDGRGTNVLENTNGAVLKLELPPQQGPIVISDTHPDQELWYRNSNVTLKWDVGLPTATGYSYTVSDNPTDVPDDISDTSNTEVTYKTVPDGINYFHIKAFRDGRWGGVSRYSLKIDQSAPADFAVEVIPGVRTTVTKPIFQFVSSDWLSGLDHYEIKLIPLKVIGRDKAISTELLFTEATSPYVPEELMYGTYQVVVRAYDKAGNLREQSQKFTITDSWFWFVSQDGLTMPFIGQVRWKVIIPSMLIFILALVFMAYVLRRYYKHHHEIVTTNAIPSSLQSQIDELNKYRARYGKIVGMFLLVLVLSGFIPYLAPTSAQAAEIDSPVIDSYSSNIKDDELFYVSGRTTEPNTDVVVHLQSMVDGSSFDFTTTSDKRGDWTYRHSGFLFGGKYIIWAHAKDGDQLSVPSPQVEIDVKPIAVSWGGTRVTYQTIYLISITVLVVIIIVLTILIIVAWVLARRRRREFAHTVRLTEEGLKHGFMSLKRDLEAELGLLHRANLGAELAGEANVRAQQLRDDLKNIEDIVGREVVAAETFAHLKPADQD